MQGTGGGLPTGEFIVLERLVKTQVGRILVHYDLYIARIREGHDYLARGSLFYNIHELPATSSATRLQMSFLSRVSQACVHACLGSHALRLACNHF